MALMSHFYDEQIRRYLLQVARLFSNFQVQTGTQRDGSSALIRVPVRYGGGTREVNNIIASNSENTMVQAPQISFYVTQMSYDRDRLREPNLVDKISIRQRKYNEETQSYTNQQGNAFTVERHMPAPYTLRINVDIWTSNQNQKEQLLEQILPFFNPSMDLQSTDNYVDWASLTRIELEDITWSSRTIPYGAEDEIDIATLDFSVPIWISLPARIKKMGVIHKIIASVFDEDGEISDYITEDALLLGTRSYTTPMNYGVILLGNELKLLGPFEALTPREGEFETLSKTEPDKSWRGLVDQYGELTNGITQIRLEQPSGAPVVGTVSYHPSDPYTLLFSPDQDTLPTNTLPSVSMVIEPLKVGPGEGLDAASEGDRYLILQDIGVDDTSTVNADAWRGANGNELVAQANDIIEYDGSQWNVIFDSNEVTTVEYVTNLKTGTQYKWTGSVWVRSYEGEYINGNWAFVF